MNIYTFQQSVQIELRTPKYILWSNILVICNVEQRLVIALGQQKIAENLS